ncbi:MAG TPA: Flp pilus assembly protein CpaB [Candidatus Dormibacteraeota bacterium]|nr:Flp pilus assembly protein CpaB [Candidatus Dormibacteraeota bacterium]
MQEAITTARRRRPFTILGMVLALITLGAFLFVATRGTGSATPSGVSGNTGNRSEVVAKVDIPARATITSDMLTVSKVTAAAPQSFASVSDIAGKTEHFPLIDIKAGQPLLANELVTSTTSVPGSGPQFLDIPQGFVALTIPTSEETGVAGYIQPGDYIGIIAVVDKAGVTTSKTVFNNVHVIRVGTATTTIAPGRTGPTATVSSGTGSSLTVVMNECDAEYVTWFLAAATLRYTLENYQDYNQGVVNNPQTDPACAIDKATGVTNADVAKRFGSDVVP